MYAHEVNEIIRFAFQYGWPRKLLTMYVAIVSDSKYNTAYSVLRF